MSQDLWIFLYIILKIYIDLIYFGIQFKNFLSDTYIKNDVV